MVLSKPGVPPVQPQRVLKTGKPPHIKLSLDNSMFCSILNLTGLRREWRREYSNYFQGFYLECLWRHRICQSRIDEATGQGNACRVPDLQKQSTSLYKDYVGLYTDHPTTHHNGVYTLLWG